MRTSELTLREKAGQLMFPRLGSNMQPPVTAAEDLPRLQKLLDEVPLGGLIVFNGSLDTTPEALNRLQQQSPLPLLVSADMERGVGQQIRGATVFPHAMAYSAAGQDAESLVEEAARIQAREALACGIHITFSPDADVNTDPRNPIIATRAFSSIPEEAAQLVRAFVRGCAAEGALSTAKHFPGHGRTSRDSHEELPVVDISRGELERTELVPFRAAIEAGVDLIMTSHILYPALDEKQPATFSRPILSELLRHRMGFEGAVITDSLLMGAVADRFADAGRQAVALVRAGVDIFLDVPDPGASIEALVQAVESGEIEEQRLDASVDRILRLKTRLRDHPGGSTFEPPDSEALARVGSDEHWRAARRAARQSIKIIGGEADLPAIGDDGDGVLAVLIRPHASRLDPPEQPFAPAFKEAFSRGEYRHLGPDSGSDAYEEVRRLAKEAAVVILALVVKPAAWHAYGLLPPQKALADELVRSQQSVVVSLGSPYILDEFKEARVRLCAYSDVEVSQRAVVDFLRRHRS